MKKILSAFVKYPFYGKMFILVLVLIGSISMMNIKKGMFPMVETTTITVSVSYSGATPKEMEEGVTTLIENAIRGIPGIKEFSSTSQENSATVTIEAVASYDIDELLSEVKNSVDGISNFPADAEQPVVSKQRRTDMAMFAHLVSTTNDLMDLSDEANRIEDDFLASGLMSQVTIAGFPDTKEIDIEINEIQRKRYNIELTDIQAAIAANNLDIHGGTIKNKREEISIVTRKRSVDVEDIKNIVVKTADDGKIVRVGDVADVTYTFQDTPSGSYTNKQPSVTIIVKKLKTEDLGAISKYVHTYLEEYNKTHDNAQMHITHDFSDNIDSQLETLIQNGIMGVILIIVMLSLSLNFRLSLWVAWGIPASFLGMFILAAINGITINIISLFGMILILGILVDDGVVIGENIFTHFEKGKSPRRAAIEGTLEVLPAIFTSVATTIIAFMPLFFIEGNLRMMYDMAFVVVCVLIVSLIEAVFVLPGHLANPAVLKPLNTESFYGKIRMRSENMIMFLNQKLYQPVLRRILNNKAIALSIVTGAVIITFGLVASGKIAFVFFPGQPADMFSIDLALKPGTSEEITKEKLFWIEDMVWEANQELMEEYGDTMSYVASTGVYTGSAFDGAESGTSAGMLRVFVNSFSDTEMTDDILKQKIAEKTSDIPEAYKYAVGASNRFGAPVSYSILGYDTDIIDKARADFEDELSKISSLYNITNNSQLGNQEISLSLKTEAYQAGVTYTSLMEQVRAAFYGSLAQRMQEGKDEIWIYVRYPENNRATIGQLEKMIIHTSDGDYPLETLANITMERNLSSINRYNGRREIEVDAYMKDQDENITPILADIENNIIPRIQAKYPEVTFFQQGQQKDSSEQMGSMVLYFGVAFLIIILIVMIYFKSFGQGLMILMMIPLGIVGAIWGHAIHGQPISMMSLWGFVALSGTVINDSIVFLAKYNSNLVRGMKVYDAIRDAGRARFRAILLTTLTTYVGIMPLIFSTTPDARMLISMSIALAYGILFGTFFILLVLPVLVMIFNKVNFSFAKMRRKDEELTPEMIEVAVINNSIEETLQKAMDKEIED